MPPSCMSVALPDGAAVPKLRGTVTLPDGRTLPVDCALTPSAIAELGLAQQLGGAVQARSHGRADAAADLRTLVSKCKSCRAELSKMHRQLNALERTVHKELKATKHEALAAARRVAPQSQDYAPIGWIESCFTERNGTPRQPGLAPAARSRLRVRCGNNPAHTLAGVESYSHVWLLFHFHRNRGVGAYSKSKVRPPRLDGAPVGVFGCRSPHRPNPIGLSLVRVDSVDGDSLVFRGADLIDGTPVLDIKPYLPYADAPRADGGVRAPDWVETGGKPRLGVEMSDDAREQLTRLCSAGPEGGARAAAAAGGEEESSAAGADVAARPPLRFFGGDPAALSAALVQLLEADPRSVYRKQKCEGEELRVRVDGIEARCRFGDRTAHVLSVRAARPAEAGAEGGVESEDPDDEADDEFQFQDEFGADGT